MCTPLAAVAAGAEVGGQVLQNQAAGKARDQQAANSASQLALSKEEFDKRLAAQQTADAASNQLSVEGQNAVRTNQDAAFNTTIGAENAQIARDSGSSDQYYSALGNTLAEQAATQGSARTNYDATVAAENATQAAARGQADSTVNNLIANSGTTATNADQATAEAQRSALAQYAMGRAALPTTATPIGAGESASTLKFDTAKANEQSAEQAARGGHLSAYGDALTTGGNRITSAGNDLALIDLKSKASLGALPYTLAPSSLQYSDANSRAADQRTTAATTLQGQVAGSAAQTQTTTLPIKQYTDTVDQALSDYYTSRLSSNSDYANKVVGGSQHYEDTTGALTNYKNSNTHGVSTLGDLMSGMGQVGLSAAASGGGPSWGEVSNLASDPYGVTSAMGPTQPSTYLGKAVF